MGKTANTEKRQAFFSCRVVQIDETTRYIYFPKETYTITSGEFELVATAVRKRSNEILTATLDDGCVILKRTLGEALPRGYKIAEATEEILRALTASCRFLAGYDPHYFHDKYLKNENEP